MMTPEESAVEVIETTQIAEEHRVPVQEPVIEKVEVVLNYGEFRLKIVTCTTHLKCPRPRTIMIKCISFIYYR